ncbi:multidrug effflux MFS transporter [Albimonas sp. CAU 1670]|uniref:multidrug effflux MFS transporter n=1 Tax=Albimonas sp. CAU 1670 TaxID=3032599 RepID=UPI0023DA11E8|nr:multidrug effflux MFS transporter [Albimonas sp. CAU 1670]MDF2232144.1 multidrug effflux MFS transporter [Albimonas sp. CAU 1670]
MSTNSPLPSRRRFDRRTPPSIFTLVAMAGLGALSMNIFLPSMPGMAKEFGVDYAVMQFAVSAYLLVMGALQLVIGPMSDRMGRRPVLLVAVAVFALATVGCLMSETIESFMVFRMLQTTASAGMVLSRAMVRDMSTPETAAQMMGYVAMCMAVVPMVGPLIGGMLEESFGWHANFTVLLVVALSVLALCWADAGETNRHPSASFGEQFRAYPELVRSHRFWGYALACACASGAFFAFLGGAPYVASEVLGLSPSKLGGYFMFMAGGYMAGNFLTTRFARRLGIDRMIVIGALLNVASMSVSALLFLAGVLHPLSLFLPTLFVGIGSGMAMPNAMAGQLSVRPHLAGSASGLGSTLMLGGGAVLSALTGWLLEVFGGALPLPLMLVATGLAMLGSMLFVASANRRRGPLPAGEPGAREEPHGPL